VAQWIRRWSTEPDIPGSVPSGVAALIIFYHHFVENYSSMLFLLLFGKFRLQRYHKGFVCTQEIILWAESCHFVVVMRIILWAESCHFVVVMRIKLTFIMFFRSMQTTIFFFCYSESKTQKV
jgi:hypothetical protein